MFCNYRDGMNLVGNNTSQINLNSFLNLKTDENIMVERSEEVMKMRLRDEYIDNLKSKSSEAKFRAGTSSCSLNSWFLRNSCRFWPNFYEFIHMLVMKSIIVH